MSETESGREAVTVTLPRSDWEEVVRVLQTWGHSTETTTYETDNPDSARNAVIMTNLMRMVGRRVVEISDRMNAQLRPI